MDNGEGNDDTPALPSDFWKACKVASVPCKAIIMDRFLIDGTEEVVREAFKAHFKDRFNEENFVAVR